MKRILPVITLIALLLSACAGGDHTSTTEIATQSPTVETTQAPATQEATEVSPSMENLPVEWAEKIDRVETMKNMDGTERIVAIQKAANPDDEAKLRALQWDGKEWVSYVPRWD